MKKILLAVVAMVACYGTICAQSTDRQRLTREELAEKQARYIADEIAMDDAASKRFVETFCRFQKEIWALGPRVGRDSLRNAATVTDAETEQEIEARFEHSQKILDIRRKYYKEYSEFLTQQQIKRVYELERQMMNRLASRRKKE